MKPQLAGQLLKLVCRYLLVLFGASIAVFVLLRIAPGNPVEIALGLGATEELIATRSHQLGFDRPLIHQYFSWIGGMLHGDFGLSLTSGTPISPQVTDHLAVSLWLIGLGMALAVLIAIPVGTWAARHHNRFDGMLITTMSQIGIAIPSFLAGVLLVTVFAVELGWFPANGWLPPNQSFFGFLQRLVLPVLALAAVQGAIMTRYVRSAMMDLLSEDFIRTAQAKGRTLTGAMLKEGLPSALIPILTVAGVQLSTIIVGAVVIERVFVIPGIGSMLLDAVAARDLTTVQTIVMILVAFALIVTAVVDFLGRILDPRLRR